MEKNRQIFIKGGEKISVKEKIYKGYMSFVWRDKKFKERHKEASYEVMLENGYDCSDSKLVDEIVADKILLEELLKALETLTEDERSLIKDYYFDEQTFQQCANNRKTNLSQIYRQHKKIVKKLRNLLTKCF